MAQPEIDWGDDAPKSRSWESDDARRVRQAKHARELEWQAEKRRAARLRLLVGIPLSLGFLGAGTAVGLDYSGIYPLGIFDHSSPPVVPAVAAAPESPAVRSAPPPPVAVPVVAIAPVQATPLALAPEPATPAMEPGQAARLRERLDHANSGVRIISDELAERQSAITANDAAIYGRWTSAHTRMDEGYLRAQRVLGQRLAEQQAAYNASRTPTNRQAMDDTSTALERVNVMLANAMTTLTHDVEVAKSLAARLAKARADRDQLAGEAKAAGIP